ncbi:hypothetical protein LCGC14_2497430, partial [marine sediment metagenome]
LGDIDERAAAVIAPSRIALGVFVGQDRALRLENGAADDVLRGDQLEFGVRALLIDTWYGVLDGGSVRTDLGPYDDERALVVDELGEEVVAAGERVGGRIGVGASDGKRRTFLCHGLCELGATDLPTALADIREFLEDNPREVLIILIQDAISPRDTEGAFEESGLIDFVYPHTPGAKLPTLREMIRRDERVLVMAEEDASGVDWYQQGFELTQETPFKFQSPEEFSCKLNRGERSSPLFLLNHWIEKATPSPSDAAEVNAFDFLLERARRCEKQRGKLPNLVAVNFYDRGEVLEVVDELRFVARQELLFGLHVHVGIDDPEKAIHVANGMRVHLPIVLALSTNSPFWRGVPTGLMSTRTPIFKSFPRVGIPPRYESWDDFQSRVEFMVEANVVDDYTYFWWDVRPHPNLGTVETRICDAQTRLEHTMAIAALIQAMCKELAEHYEAGYELSTYPQEMLEENKWLAARHGLEGELVDLPRSSRVAAVDLARRLVERLRPH